jgi:methylphosphotriester-DNA--protein-cysteine methyltransferase
MGGVVYRPQRISPRLASAKAKVKIVIDDLPPAWLSDACAFIESNAESRPSAEDVAVAVGVTSERLLEVFSHYLEFTPADYLADLLVPVGSHMAYARGG